MTPDGLQPPDQIPSRLVERFRQQDPDTLRVIATYAERLANHEETDVERELDDRDADDPGEPPEEWDEEEWMSVLTDVDAPSKATLTVKTINDNDYYYYQWREGDSIESEYVAPVSPSK